VSSNFGGHTKVTITQAAVVSLPSNKSVDVSRMLTFLEVRGSIFDSTMTGTAHIRDPSSILHNLPLTGEEVFQLQFHTELAHATPFSKLFYIHKVDDLHHDPNGSMMGVTLHFVSMDQINAISNRVISGANQTISQMVQGILQNNIKVDSSYKLNIEATQGIESLVFPGWNCWKTIEFLRQRAVSNTYKSPYFFFEDNTGYNFISCEALIAQKKAAGIKTYTSAPWNPYADQSASAKDSVNSSQKYNVENLRILKKSNTADFINGGGAYNLTQIDTKLTDMPSNVRQPLDGQFNPQRSSALSKIVTTPPIQYMASMDDTNPTSFIQNIGPRRMFNRHFGDIKIGFMTFGDVLLNPGDVINLQVPYTTGQQSADPQLTGNYMIANLAHHIKESNMYTSVEAYRFGFPQKVF
jgi:hypothetical protein